MQLVGGWSRTGEGWSCGHWPGVFLCCYRFGAFHVVSMAGLGVLTTWQLQDGQLLPWQLMAFKYKYFSEQGRTETL